MSSGFENWYLGYKGYQLSTAIVEYQKLLHEGLEPDAALEIVADQDAYTKQDLEYILSHFPDERAWLLRKYGEL